MARAGVWPGTTQASQSSFSAAKSRILSATIYLPDMADFPTLNAIWEQWVVPGQTPARATVQAGLAHPAYKVEIQVIATAP